MLRSQPQLWFFRAGQKIDRVYGCVAGCVAVWGASSISFHPFPYEGELLA